MTINSAVIILDAAQESSSWGKMMMIQISCSTNAPSHMHFLKMKYTTHPRISTPPVHQEYCFFDWIANELLGLIQWDDTEEEDGGRQEEEREMETERKEREGVASYRQLKAMRGTAVRSFLSGSVHPHTPHTSLFNCSAKRPKFSWVEWWGWWIYIDTWSSPNNMRLLLLFQLFVATTGLPDPFVCSGWRGHCTGRMLRVWRQWRHRERRGGYILASGTKALSLFFSLLPVVLWPTYR